MRVLYKFIAGSLSEAMQVHGRTAKHFVLKTVILAFARDICLFRFGCPNFPVTRKLRSYSSTSWKRTHWMPQETFGECLSRTANQREKWLHCCKIVRYYITPSLRSNRGKAISGFMPDGKAPWKLARRDYSGVRTTMEGSNLRFAFVTESEH